MRLILRGIAALGLAAGLSAQAAGELRDAEDMVFRAFPEADSFRTIVRDVDQQARTQVERRLPFKVHFNELGPHALYVAFRGRKPLGLVYLRTEEAQWGFAEIGWALTLDLRVLGFRLSRGRSRHLEDFDQSAFGRSLTGRDFDGIAALLDPTSNTPPVPGGAEVLAKVVLRSAMKAILVTDLVWHEEVVKLQDLAMGFDAFPAAESFRRQVVRFDWDKKESQHLVSVHVMLARGEARSQLGSVVRTEAMIGGRSVTLRWIVDPGHTVLRIVPAQSWTAAEMRAACSELEGHRLLEGDRPDNPLQPLALELGTVLRRLAERKGSR